MIFGLNFHFYEMMSSEFRIWYNKVVLWIYDFLLRDLNIMKS